MARRITCNCCGKEMDEIGKCGVVTISETLGYGSKYDGAHVEVDICAGCFDKLIDSMRVCPIANS
mgnify:FL=1